jgi:hypothetical protein
MASYEAHAQAASDLLAPIKLGKIASYELRAQVAQVEALLALAAAIAGRQAGAPSRPPQHDITDSR